MASDLIIDDADSETPLGRDANEGEYVVVARRYRPQSFVDLVGQDQVSQALRNAINTNRVGHAYLFTGARGVGKTSTARILAKCLNCVEGPTPTPCGRCDCCQGVATGDDIDVLEIDGASNRGIDEIRELRSNVNIRPSRSRFKIYIIDEVHMLTVQAFNALLKTLEEPPEHVKFIFCTTDSEKIPITVLSRCQRFDFAPVAADAILERLRQIVDSEGVPAEDAALQILARRAGGSMRDSQSLLEQLLSFCSQGITERDVHAMLGTAQSGRLASLVGGLIERQPAKVLAELDLAVREGVDVGQLAEQLLGYLRDLLAAAVGCPVDGMLHTSAADFPTLSAAGQQWGVETILAAVQILDQAITRMRQSMHVRTLVEMAMVRICKLEDLDSLPHWIAAIRDGGNIPASAAGATTSRPRPAVASPAAASPPASASARPEPARVAAPSPPPTAAEKKKVDVAVDLDAANRLAAAAADEPNQAPPRATPRAEPTPPPADPATQPLTADSAVSFWRQAVAQIGGMTADIAGSFLSLTIAAPNQLVVRMNGSYNKQWCERPDVKRKLEETMASLTGRTIRIEFVAAETAAAKPRERAATMNDRRQKMRDLEKHPLVQEAITMFDAEIVNVHEPRPPS